MMRMVFQNSGHLLAQIEDLKNGTNTAEDIDPWASLGPDGHVSTHLTRSEADRHAKAIYVLEVTYTDHRVTLCAQSQDVLRRFGKDHHDAAVTHPTAHLPEFKLVDADSKIIATMSIWDTDWIDAEGTHDPRTQPTEREILIRSAKAQIGDLIDQINQMKGMFPDDDKAIENAIADAEAWPSDYFDEGTNDLENVTK